MDYKEYWEQMYKTSDELNSLISSYWSSHSHVGTWQFWVVFSLLTLPLILLYFTIDRKRIFEILFFGYTIHILWTYISIPLEREGYFVHTFFLTPKLPFALNMTAVVLPVSFLLLYQYCTNKDKNYYVYSILLSVFFAIGVASLEDYLGLVEFRKGMNQLYLLAICIAIAFVAYWLTKLIRKQKNRPFAS